MNFFTELICAVVVTHGTITSYLYVMSFELNLPLVLQREYPICSLSTLICSGLRGSPNFKLPKMYNKVQFRGIMTFK